MMDRPTDLRTSTTGRAHHQEPVDRYNPRPERGTATSGIYYGLLGERDNWPAQRGAGQPVDRDNWPA